MGDVKQILALDDYDLEEANLQPINPGDAFVQPGERVEIVEGEWSGEQGVVQAVGYAAGVYGCIVADVLVDGTSDPERVPQEDVEVLT